MILEYVTYLDSMPTLGPAFNKLATQCCIKCKQFWNLQAIKASKYVVFYLCIGYHRNRSFDELS